MTSLAQLLLRMQSTWHQLKDEKQAWALSRQPQQQQFEQAQLLAEQALVAELKKRSVQLEHELAMLQTTNATQLAMLKTKCQQDLKDYKQYLEALEQLKTSIQKSYTHLPAAVAFTIHHHAKHLLNTMWEADNLDEKMRQEMQLIQFMSTVHEDARLYLAGETTAQLPEKTLAMLQQQ